MTLTREQIEELRQGIGTEQDGAITLSAKHMNALCDLALAALDLRERAAKVCEEHAAEMDDDFQDSQMFSSRGAADAALYLAERIRALPLTPTGADQRGEAAVLGPLNAATSGAPDAARGGHTPEQSSPHQLPAEQQDNAGTRQFAECVSEPARAEEPRCPDGLLPDGPVCPRCGERRGPSGVGGGSWVHY